MLSLHPTITIGQSYKSHSGLEFLIVRRHSKENAFLGVAFSPVSNTRPITELVEHRFWFTITGQYMSGLPPGYNTMKGLNHNLIVSFRPPEGAREPMRLRRIALRFIDTFPISWTDEEVEAFVISVLDLEEMNVKLEEMSVQRLLPPATIVTKPAE